MDDRNMTAPPSPTATPTSPYSAPSFYINPVPTGTLPTQNDIIAMQKQQIEQLHQAQTCLHQFISMSFPPNGNGSYPYPPIHDDDTKVLDDRDSPNFSRIYSFLGSLFDPTPTNHAEALEQMSEIDRRTVQMLMNNLYINLANQQFKAQHALLLEQYRALLKNYSSSPQKSPAQDINSSMGNNEGVLRSRNHSLTGMESGSSSLNSSTSSHFPPLSNSNIPANLLPLPSLPTLTSSNILLSPQSSSSSNGNNNNFSSKNPLTVLLPPNGNSARATLSLLSSGNS